MTIALELFKTSDKLQTFAAGETIFETGQIGDFMYVILEGEVEIRGDSAPLAILSAGEIFGEMALIDNSPRCATARAFSECRVVPVDQYNFTYYVQHSPFFAIQVMSVMANRLRQQMVVKAGPVDQAD